MANNFDDKNKEHDYVPLGQPINPLREDSDDNSNIQNPPKNINDHNIANDFEEDQPYYQHSAPTYKRDKKFVFTLCGIIGIFLILVIICIASFFSGAKKPTHVHHEKTVKIKQLPDDKKSNADSISKEEASDNIKSAINLGFKSIKDSKAVSGNGMDISDLPQTEIDKINSTFKSAQVLQDFNDTVNVSSDSSSQRYGDAGTGIKSVKRAKAGTPYLVKSVNINYQYENEGDYIFNVRLKYHPKGFKNRTVSLVIGVDSGTGKISQVKQQI